MPQFLIEPCNLQTSVELKPLALTIHILNFKSFDHSDHSNHFDHFGHFGHFGYFGHFGHIFVQFGHFGHFGQLARADRLKISILFYSFQGSLDDDDDDSPIIRGFADDEPLVVS